MKAIFTVLGCVLVMSPLSLQAQEAGVFEMRTYTASEGKMEALLKRFREHTLGLFESHGMVNVGYWLTKEEAPKLVYLIKHESEEAAKENWAAFRNDPKWQAAFKASRVDGKLVMGIDSQFLAATDFSKIQ